MLYDQDPQKAEEVGETMNFGPADIAHNLRIVRENIAKAAAVSARSSTDIRLVGVTKNVSVACVNVAVDEGLTHLGENRVQEMRNKRSEVNETARWHLIGGLQTNKVKYCIGTVDLIHSLDRDRLAEEIGKRAARANITVDALVQVNSTGNSRQGGVPFDEVIASARRWSRIEGLSLKGLMTIAPFTEDENAIRIVCRRMYRLFEQLRELDLDGATMHWLSMGMSHDYSIAIEEGANLVRIGTAIFGPRQVGGTT